MLEVYTELCQIRHILLFSIQHLVHWILDGKLKFKKKILTLFNSFRRYCDPSCLLVRLSVGVFVSVATRFRCMVEHLMTAALQIFWRL